VHEDCAKEKEAVNAHSALRINLTALFYICQNKNKKIPEYPGGNREKILMEESMKKVLLIALLAMMMIGMLSMSACKPKPEEEAVEEIMPEEEIMEENGEAVDENGEAAEEPATENM
jgi:hypothetical protein